MISLSEIEARVSRELSIIEDTARREALRSLLCPPRIEVRDWDYGREGERYAYWVVAESVEHGILFAHCEEGFGPEFPWGFLPMGAEFSSLGMDAQWCWYLEEAFVRSGLWSGPMKPGFEEAFHEPPEVRFGPAGAPSDRVPGRMSNEEQPPRVPPLHVLAEETTDAEWFLRFVRALLAECRDMGRRGQSRGQSNAWANVTLTDHLEAAVAWAEDSAFTATADGSAATAWRQAARFLYVGTIYE